jgi:periplasmic divalent cation tolerance protein
MTNAMVVLCTCGNHQHALQMGGALIQERLAACVNIMPGIQSIYRWKGEVEQCDEVLMLIKTTGQRFEALRDRVKELHPYETPEIVALHVADGLGDYLKWIGEEVG